MSRSVAGVLESYGSLEQRISQELDEAGSIEGRETAQPRAAQRRQVALGPALGQETTYWSRLPAIGAG